MRPIILVAMITIALALGYTQVNAAAIHNYASTGDIHGVQQELDAHVDVDIRDTKGWTALMYAARANQRDIVELLIQHNADINAKNDFGLTALMAATKSNHPEVLMLLLQQPKIDVNMTTDGCTPLMKAASHHNINILTLLLSHPEINVNAKGKKGYTALIKAAGASCTCSCDPQSVTLLLQAGAQVDIIDKQGDNALAWATKAKRGDVEEVERLLLQVGWPRIKSAIR